MSVPWQVAGGVLLGVDFDPRDRHIVGDFEPVEKPDQAEYDDRMPRPRDPCRCDVPGPVVAGRYCGTCGELRRPGS